MDESKQLQRHIPYGFCSTCRFAEEWDVDQLPPELRGVAEKLPYQCHVLPAGRQIQGEVSPLTRQPTGKLTVSRVPNFHAADDDCGWYAPRETS
ncbi:MAG: hypothetical protein ABIG85_08115 [Chloroflexota bacterium]